LNSLQELRQALKTLGKEVSEFTGHSLVADGVVWGLVHDDPIRDGVTMAPADWKAYVKATKKGEAPPPIQGYMTAEKLAEKVGAPPVVKPKQSSQSAQITCPHCNKTGGAAGMKIFHFDRCKKKL